MDSEYYDIPIETASIINEAKKKKKKVWTVGTSTNRALETVVVSGFEITSKKGWTDKFIYPPYKLSLIHI